MKIALIGYGKMGRAVETEALERGWQVVARIGRGDALAAAQNADVAIEFTAPDQFLSNATVLTALGVPLVTGTTGWQDQLPAVEKLASENGILYADNFSIGMHLFNALVAEASRLASQYGGFDVAGSEVHHTQKKDSPSGTARQLAQTVLENMRGKERALFDRPKAPLAPDELHFSSMRCGSVMGSHTLTFSTPGETITLTHDAQSRSIWARGALDAAEWLHGRQGLFRFEDMLNERRGCALCTV